MTVTEAVVETAENAMVAVGVGEKSRELQFPSNAALQATYEPVHDRWSTEHILTLHR